uniref:Uncharacterized protein n=1 Tax=Fagus sylvatica TaxID=28930 RepID=A0A2N9ELK0_FAGSY
MAKKKNYGRLAKYVHTSKAMATFRHHYGIPDDVRLEYCFCEDALPKQSDNEQRKPRERMIDACGLQIAYNSKVTNIEAAQRVVENQPAPHHDIRFMAGFSLKELLPPRPISTGETAISDDNPHRKRKAVELGSSSQPESRVEIQAPSRLSPLSGGVQGSLVMENRYRSQGEELRRVIGLANRYSTAKKVADDADKNFWGILTLVTRTDFPIRALTVVTLEYESLVTPERIRVCTLDRTLKGILTLVTRMDFLIHALTVMTLEYEFLVTSERIRVCALDRTLRGVLNLVT